MFGVIVSGRLVQTGFERVGETQFLFNIPDADNVNYLVVFLTGVEPFPETMGGLVYFSWPDSVNSPQSWQLLGHISNQKPSAIFKISKLKKVYFKLCETPATLTEETSPHPFLRPTSHVAQIGISVEALDHINLQTPVASATPTSLDTFVEFTTKMLENFFNYAASFSLTQQTMQQNPSETYVPLRVLQSWFTNFQRRLQQNPHFWKS